MTFERTTSMKMLCLLLSVMFSCMVMADDETPEVFSGPQPGEQIPGFAIQGVRGDEAGKSIDLVGQAKRGPLLIVFFHERSRPAFGLANTVARFAETKAEKGLISGIVFLTADATETENWLKAVNANLPKKTQIGISPDGLEGPGTLGLNRNVALTVIVANEEKVTANFALRQPSVDVDGPKIFKAIVDVTGGGDVPEVSSFSGSGRMAAQRKSNGKWLESTDQERADVKLRQFLRPVINQSASEDEVLEAAAKVEEEAASDAAFRTRVFQAATRIIEAGKLKDYGTPKAQEFLSKWAVDFEPSKADAEKPKERSQAPGKK
jgi:hypothetical protein